ncbi:hypothetical protein [Blastopirellula marina]|uniref:Tetratricopeptide repeat-like domain-containing protein n=1 Tax=Blastopirellula marina TaxID=124 RepID=A0A2S8GD76_9BACT|nr:hypothetical protein [Blastopirellula marina]PQO42415.1 hypothetical protein C5Y93_29235 [Blastopirellula marina]
MKSERRHEIQENSLAHFLETVLESARPHATLIGGVLLAVVLAYIGYVVMMQDGGPVKHDQWNSVLNAVDQSFRVADDDVQQQALAEEFATIAKNDGDTRPGLWAEYFSGLRSLTQAGDVAYSDPKSATADLERAIQAFQKTYAETDLPVLKVKALWSMAEAYQLQATPASLDRAKANFEEISKIWPDSNTARAAQERIERLDNAAITGKDGFYAWYRDHDFAAQPRAPLGGNTPGLDMNLEPSGGMFNSPGGTVPGADINGMAPPGTENTPLFTPSMDLEGPTGEVPKASSFTEPGEAKPEEKPAPMADSPMADPPMETAPMEEAPMKEEAAAPEKPAEEAPMPEAKPMAEAAEKPAEEASEAPEKPAKEEEDSAEPK